MKLGLIVKTPSGKSPFIRTGGKTGRVLLREAESALHAVPSQGVRGRLDSRPVIIASTQQANAVVTAASVAAADTVTISGTALTATELRANCTVTVGISVDEDDTVTVNGTVFTAKTAVTDATTQFAITGVAATDALALATAINASTDAGVYGLIGAVRRAADGVVSIYALATGTAGNAYTIATSDAVDLAITNDNAGSFAGGAATGNNQFDPFGTNTMVATELARAIRESTTSLISGHVSATTKQAIITAASIETGDTVSIAGVVLRARTGTHSVTTGLAVGEFSMNGTDAQDATSLVACINEHPTLSQLVFARLSGSTCIVYERAPSLGQPIPISTSNGTRLAITGSVTELTAGAAVYIESILPGIAGNATTLATSNGTRLAITHDSSGRLAGGTASTYTY